MNARKAKQVPWWKNLLWETLAVLVLYMLGAALLAFLTVRGVIPETGVFSALAVLCGLLSFLAAGYGVRVLPWGGPPRALVPSLVFSGSLVIIGVAFWHGIAWTGNGGVLILCVLGAGGLAVLAGGRRRKGKGKRKR